MYRRYVPDASWTVSTFSVKSHGHCHFNVDYMLRTILMDCGIKCILASLLVVVLCTELINGTFHRVLSALPAHGGKVTGLMKTAINRVWLLSRPICPLVQCGSSDVITSRTDCCAACSPRTVYL
jgi:hypothetical protein